MEGMRPKAGILKKGDQPTQWQRAMLAARRVMEWQASIRGVDEPLAHLYRKERTAALHLAGLAAIAVAGLIAFVLGIEGLGSTVEESEAGGWLLLFWIPGFFSILIHEAGRAFTTKHFGRKVPRVGVGWFWFGSIAYVDTSDMWLEGRWPRIAASLAGPLCQPPPRRGDGIGGMVFFRLCAGDAVAVFARLLYRSARKSKPPEGV